eukprot:COSAG04_NODE_23262_length_341_cov_0.851240_2_plen_55_part_01
MSVSGTSPTAARLNFLDTICHDGAGTNSSIGTPTPVTDGVEARDAHHMGQNEPMP